jgi:ATP phosphoribosyltransferase
MKQMTIALPKGRLLEKTLSLFAAVGVTPSDNRSRRLMIDSTDGRFRFLLVKPFDVPTYVEQGAADLGVVGSDVLLETEPDVLSPLDLGFGACRIVVAARTDRPASPSASRPHRVATTYPRIAKRFFTEQRIPVETIALAGSVELAPSVGLAEWIVDLVETGRTLRDNSLEAIAEIAMTRAQLIANRASQKLHREAIAELVRRLSKEVSC